jgi:hypothetical protein
MAIDMKLQVADKLSMISKGSKWGSPAAVIAEDPLLSVVITEQIEVRRLRGGVGPIGERLLADGTIVDEEEEEADLIGTTAAVVAVDVVADVATAVVAVKVVAAVAAVAAAVAVVAATVVVAAAATVDATAVAAVDKDDDMSTTASAAAVVGFDAVPLDSAAVEFSAIETSSPQIAPAPVPRLSVPALLAPPAILLMTGQSTVLLARVVGEGGIPTIPSPSCLFTSIVALLLLLLLSMAASRTVRIVVGIPD